MNTHEREELEYMERSSDTDRPTMRTDCSRRRLKRSTMRVQCALPCSKGTSQQQTSPMSAWMDEPSLLRTKGKQRRCVRLSAVILKASQSASHALCLVIVMPPPAHSIQSPHS